MHVHLLSCTSRRPRVRVVTSSRIARQVCGKVAGDALFGWRQHPRQHTRTHGRLSIENLRKVKVHFLMRKGGPLFPFSRIIVVSVGVTLAGWEEDLRAHPRSEGKSILAVEWKPSKRFSPVVCKPQSGVEGGEGFGLDPKDSSHRESKEALRATQRLHQAPPLPVSLRRKPHAGQEERSAGGHCDSTGSEAVRLWAFGSETVRRRIREQVSDWEDSLDWFVA
eukprot:scaffold31180_cov40-Tisochrysis_lutea.AAC.3